MFGKIMELSTGLYVLWGIGVLGVLLKLFANAYINAMVRASYELGDTKKRKLRVMRQQYENKHSFGLCGGDEVAYTESFVRGLRFLSRPMEFWSRSGTVLSMIVCGGLAFAYLYYDPSWRGSPNMEVFLASSIIVCACLLALDNILLINNKVEILKANIIGYFERLPKPRDETQMRPAKKVETVVEQRDGKTVVETTPVSEEADKEAAADDETLNRFLAEFFSQ